MKPPSLTLGVEEEYQIIDPETRELQSYITELLEYDHRFLGAGEARVASAPSSRSDDRLSHATGETDLN